jgi:hypothetical protein
VSPERFGRVNRPSIRTEIGPAPFRKRRSRSVVGRIDPSAILRAEKPVIKVTDQLLESIQCGQLKFVASLQNRLTHIEHQAGSPLTTRVLKQYLRKIGRSELIDRRDKGVDEFLPIERRKLVACSLQTTTKLVEVSRIVGTKITVQRSLSGIFDAGVKVANVRCSPYFSGLMCTGGVRSLLGHVFSPLVSTFLPQHHQRRY